MLITPATMAPFIRFFRVIAEDAHRAPPRTTLMMTAVATVAYWLWGMPVVAHWIPYVATYGIQWATTGIPQSQYATVATAVIINVVLGGALWASSAITRKNLMNGAIVAGVISIILIYFGG